MKNCFCISKQYLTEGQIAKIINHDMYGFQNNVFPIHNDNPEVVLNTGWIVSIEADKIRGYSVADNSFDMKRFLEKIGISKTYISWGN